jgi:o-succinylbenzoate synthase
MDASVEPFALDLATPLETAGRTIETREGFLVRVETDDETGVGEATPLPGWTESLSECRAVLERAADALDSKSASAALAGLDSTPAARHGVSGALADLDARRAGVPLYRYLGSKPRVESVPVNATVGDGSPDETAEQARAAVDAGFDCLKVKVGLRAVSADADRLAAVREAVCPDVELRADANGAWDREQARRAFEAFADIDVSYVEQPLSAVDLAGHADLRGGPVGLALDETLTETSVALGLAPEATDGLVCKPMAVGGFDPTREAANRARETGVDVVVTTTIDAAVARTGAVHLAASLPDVCACGLATAELLAGDLATDPAPIEEGQVRVPQGEGLGVEGPWRQP